MDDHKTAFVFPGQGSQTVGMGHSLARSFTSAREIFLQADEMLDFSLSKLAWEGPADQVNDTVNTQPALFTHSIAVLSVLNELKIDIIPSFVAGHSMGEISALVAAGSISFPDGLSLVRTRGELMKQAGEIQPGGMAAVMGLDLLQVEQVCAQATIGSEVVQVANDNCPGQVVISGASAAIDRAVDGLNQAGARRIIRLAVSIPAHSPLMLAAQPRLEEAISATTIKVPYIPTIGNVSALPLATVEDIRADLQDQLTHRVRWTESINYMISEGVSEFYELGTGSVLGGLIKRINPFMVTHSLGTPEDFQKLASL